ncbi:Rpn family recombination-promoting nuclease/putative transposase [Ravibacter arvi]|uniref:Rpn family recombination-promoting nuclease/putative transposase n=1 Tax=Ravibacter arvi TaxID=2051041 RepID=A0ABP8LN53_9BACT
MNTTLHDNFVRAILADKEIAIDYFRSCLPQNIAARLDLSALTQLPDTYLSKGLRKTISDIVYSCRLKEDSREVKITLLLEHKSRPDKSTPVQLLGYIASAHRKQLTEDKKLSPIIPVLLYHGRERWLYRTLGALMAGLDSELMPFVPDYEYVYHDLGEIPDKQIQLLENKFLQASFLALKYSQLKVDLVRWIPTILSLAADVEKNLQRVLIVYTFGISDLKEEQIIRLIDEVPANIKSTVMSTKDVLVEMGRKEKTEKTVRNMIHEGLPTELICKVLEVDPYYVSDIRQKIEGEVS